MAKPTVEIKEPKGKLGVLLPGMGAVATTFIAGVESVRRDLSKPIGSLTQMGTMRLGKRTENRSPMIKDIVPLADINDIEFAGWDIYNDNCYESALNAGVLRPDTLDPIKDFLGGIRPMSAVFDSKYVRKLDGPNKKKGANWMELADQVEDGHQKVQKGKEHRPTGHGVVRQHRSLRGAGARSSDNRSVRRRA